ncbi:hypothetical protein [Rhodococcus maanshanensis]|uniref:hypothetical protein n=1 Tax=Rhodococcus maanshanensis TaxID=183556 RepID=UPI000935050E|nr:hypothetical protein [Rhodococcus maanshanensis]
MNDIAVLLPGGTEPATVELLPLESRFADGLPPDFFAPRTRRRSTTVDRRDDRRSRRYSSAATVPWPGRTPVEPRADRHGGA